MESYNPHERTDDQDQLRMLISHLPGDLRKVIRLRYFEGFTFSEIALELGCSRAWAQSRHTEALIKMRRAARS